MTLDPVTHAAWQDQDAVDHGFFTRRGGVSRGIHAELNVGAGSDDDRKNVVENRRRVAAHFGGDDASLVTVHQIHSPDVVVVDAPIDLNARPRADAMVTRHPGLALGVLTADCGPILFCDSDSKVIGAAHAGWRGAKSGVIENTVAAMVGLGAERSRIKAVLGPCITQPNYEVGPEFLDAFTADTPDNSRFFKPSPKADHALFDLPGYVGHMAAQSGIDLTFTGHCTYADDTRFFSYRRATHRNEPDYGRQIAVIVLKD